MNETTTLTTAHLFAGIGGMALAAKWMGWKPIAFAEIDPYASAVLAKNFPDVPNLGDVTKLRGEQVGSVDVLTGGFPCQDISLAGKGAGIAEGTRSGLWIEFGRLIGEIRPKYAVIENVAALRSRGLDRVLSDLSALGYDAEWNCIPASYSGAPHRRDRIWIVAYPQRVGQPGSGEPVYAFDPATQAAREAAHVVDGGVGCEGQWCVEPDVGRVAHGVPDRVDRLKGLGNSVVPQSALISYRAIAAREAALRGE